MSRVTDHSKSITLGLGPPPPPPPPATAAAATAAAGGRDDRTGDDRDRDVNGRPLEPVVGFDRDVYVSCLTISKVTPVGHRDLAVAGSISNEDASAPSRLYVSVSPSTSSASTGKPTSSRCSALSDTRRVGMDSLNVGASFTASIWTETEAVLERDRPPTGGLPVSLTW